MSDWIPYKPGDAVEDGGYRVSFVDHISGYTYTATDRYYKDHWGLESEGYYTVTAYKHFSVPYVPEVE